MAAGSLIAATTSASAHPAARPSAITFTTVVAKPSTNLVDKQNVKVTVTDAKGKTFNGITTLYFAECSPLAVTKLSETYCDTTNIQTVSNPTGSTATATIPIHTTTAGDFAATNPAAVCGGFNHLQCIVLVVDSQSTSTITSFGQSKIFFKDLRALSKTALSSAKKVKVGKALLLKATTKIKGTNPPTGTVIFRDGKKKLGKVKETKTGIVKFKAKFKKAGKQHITASYSGDKNYKASVGKETVTVKK